MDEHFDQVSAVGLVFGEIEDELDGAAEAERVFGDEKGAFAGGNAGGDGAPEGDGAVACEGVHEADRSAAFDAVDEDVRQRFDVRVIDRMQAAEGPGWGWHILVSLVIGARVLGQYIRDRY